MGHCGAVVVGLARELGPPSGSRAELNTTVRLRISSNCSEPQPRPAASCRQDIDVGSEAATNTACQKIRFVWTIPQAKEKNRRLRGFPRGGWWEEKTDRMVTRLLPAARVKGTGRTK